MIHLMHDLRREINALFEESGVQNRPPFLHRADSDNFLLCSDAPRRLSRAADAAELIDKAGFPLTEKDGLWFLDARVGDYLRLDSALPMDLPKKPAEERYLDIWALCRMLSGHLSDAACQPLWAVRRTLKAIEAGDRQVLSLSDSLPASLAVLLRNKEPLPSLTGKLLSWWLIEKLQKETV
jgi:hypothetical protein